LVLILSIWLFPYVAFKTKSIKKVIASIFTALAFVGLAQPQKINYLGVAVGANGKAIKNASVGLRLSVLDSLPNGSV
jgi:hypothetical protein